MAARTWLSFGMKPVARSRYDYCGSSPDWGHVLNSFLGGDWQVKKKKNEESLKEAGSIFFSVSPNPD